MAVQTLAKDQAKREKKNQKDLDEQFKKDDENAEKDAGRYMDLMDKIYDRDDISSDSYKKLMRKVKLGPDGTIIEAKKGGLMKKCGIQLKGTSPLLKKRKGKK
jgi:hypothetical protein